jgi:hypothetical protein
MENVYLGVAPYEKEKIQYLSQVAENATIKSNHNYLILDWRKVINVLLTLKSRYEALSDGSLSMMIDDTMIGITVKDNIVDVDRIDQKADLILTSQDATSILISPIGSCLRNEAINNLEKQKRICFCSWFPLPLYWHLLITVNKGSLFILIITKCRFLRISAYNELTKSLSRNLYAKWKNRKSVKSVTGGS